MQSLLRSLRVVRLRRQQARPPARLRRSSRPCLVRLRGQARAIRCGIKTGISIARARDKVRARASRCAVKTGINMARASTVAVELRARTQDRAPVMPAVPMVPAGVTVLVGGQIGGMVPLRVLGMAVAPMVPLAMVRGGLRAEATVAKVAIFRAMAPTAVVRAAAGTADGGTWPAE